MDGVYREEMLKGTHLKSYEKSNEIAFRYLNALNEEDKDEVWLCYYHLSFNSLKLKEFEEALLYSITACDIIKENASKLNHTIWLRATIFKDMGETELAIAEYLKCTIYYKGINSEKLYLSGIFEVAKLQENLEWMEEILENYLIASELKDIVLYKKEEYDVAVIKEMYIEIIKKYVVVHKTKEIFRLINSIYDKDFRTELGRLYLAA